jgi:hypothetical protein
MEKNLSVRNDPMKPPSATHLLSAFRAENICEKQKRRRERAGLGKARQVVKSKRYMAKVNFQRFPFRLVAPLQENVTGDNFPTSRGMGYLIG